MNLGDNYVTGDNIYLRELQNFFFEVLGMMSITHYGAIGDGRTDNYGPLQVAIDDANRRGIIYLYVPYGRFIYTGELINMDNITFVGNPHSKIVNIRTAEEIPILQFGLDTTQAYYTKEEADDTFEKKTDLTNDYYNKAATDILLDTKISKGVVTDFWSGTQEEYDEIDPKSATTLYLVDGE